MKTMIFTGAGASKAIGYPLTRELLPQLREDLKNKKLFKGLSTRQSEGQDRAALIAYLNRLLPGMDRLRDDDLPLITDVFSMVEYALVAGDSLPVGGESDLRRFRDLLKQAITDILLGEYLEDWNLSVAEHIRQKKVLTTFASRMKKYMPDVGLVTTNYDIGFESVLYQHLKNIGSELDLGFDWRDAGSDRERCRPARPRLRVYKLHGSLDVLKCKRCGYVYFNPFGTIAHQSFKPDLDDNNTCVCNDDERLELHIVSPSLVRDIRDANLLSIWRSALEFMRNAEEWIIIGYSLPPEDLAIRSLLMRAYAGAENPPKITVVQFDEKEKSRYELLFPDCTYRSGGLEKYLGL